MGPAQVLSGWPERLDFARLCGKALIHRFKARREKILPGHIFSFKRRLSVLWMVEADAMSNFSSGFSAKWHFELHWVVRTGVLRLEDNS